MAKFSKISKLSSKEQQSLLIEFCKALVEIRTPEESAQFIKDLVSKQEAEMLAKRIAIARLLIQGKNYNEIRSALKVSTGTIARISHWLTTSGEGYRLIVQRVKPEKPEKTEKQKIIEELEKPFSWKLYKRKHPLYFWPEIVLEEIIKSASKKHKDRLRNILDKLEDKTEMFEELKPLLKEEYAKRTIKTKLDKYSNNSKY